MTEKKLSRNLILVFGSSIMFIGILVILFSDISFPIKDSVAKAITVTKTITKETEKTTPMSLRIPSLKINTVLEQVGLTAQGAVGVPESILKAAWFTSSVKPGLTGNMVIVGHFGWKRGVPAIFNNLAKLQKGDKIYVDDGGKQVTFIVQKMQKYNQNSVVPAIFISSDNKSHLNLITCDGIWNKVTKSYLERLVIFTDKE